MLLHGEFYLARQDNEQLEVIERFMEDDETKSLLIIDQYLAIENIKNLRADHNCYVVFLNNDSNPNSENRKIIYIHESFDAMAQDFITNYWGMLAFF
jgi:hypothetical protein